MNWDHAISTFKSGSLRFATGIVFAACILGLTGMKLYDDWNYLWVLSAYSIFGSIAREVVVGNSYKLNDVEEMIKCLWVVFWFAVLFLLVLTITAFILGRAAIILEWWSVLGLFVAWVFLFVLHREYA